MSQARDLADLGSSAEQGTVTGESLIINGDMTVAQRGTSKTALGNGDSGYHTVDRFQFVEGGSPTGEFTMSQSTEAPEGFSNSLKMECTTADTALAASDSLEIRTVLEGQDLQVFKKGTSNAEKMALSFWVRSDKTGTYTVGLIDKDNSNRITSKSYSIDTADTWEYKTLIFDGDTTGAFANDNGRSLDIGWYLGAGTTYTTGTLATTWQADDSADRVHSSQVNLSDTVGNEWYITGVKLEVGSTATPFQHESYGENLLKCQRYFFRVPIENTFEAQPVWIYFTNVASTRIPLGVVMRSAPTVLIEGDTGSATDWDVYYSGAFRTISNINAANITSNSFRLNMSASGLTSGGAAGLYSRSADAGLIADAEL